MQLGPIPVVSMGIYHGVPGLLYFYLPRLGLISTQHRTETISRWQKYTMSLRAAIVMVCTHSICSYRKSIYIADSSHHLGTSYSQDDINAAASRT